MITFQWSIPVTTSSPSFPAKSTSIAGSTTTSGDNSQCFRCAEGDVEGTEGESDTFGCPQDMLFIVLFFQHVRLLANQEVICPG